ncbi:MAG: hypothetical protein H7312_21125 [Tardiphaga sp.]|nr:hypothetical protein [Tardiphaga sp.]
MGSVRWISWRGCRFAGWPRSMSVVWTTVAIILLLLPGGVFFVGLASYERFSREIIRREVVSEVALATMVSIVLHSLCLVFLSAMSGFRLSPYYCLLQNMHLCQRRN